MDSTNVSAFEYAMLEERDGDRLELIRGRVVREPAPGGVHGKVLLALLRMLDPHVRAHSLGQVLVETGVRYRGTPHTVRRPDVAFIAASRLPPTTPISFWETAPDLIIEILSPSDRPAAVRARTDTDFEAGVRIVWIVDPRARVLTVHTNGAPPRTYDAEDVVHAHDVLAGLVFRVRDLFADID